MHLQTIVICVSYFGIGFAAMFRFAFFVSCDVVVFSSSSSHVLFFSANMLAANIIPFVIAAICVGGFVMVHDKVSLL
jgi:hypothetical protein